MPLLLHALGHLSVLLLLAVLAWAAGWLAWGRRRPELLVHPFLPVLGFGLLGQLALLLAAGGALRPLPVALAAAVLLLAAAPGLAAAAREAWRRLQFPGAAATAAIALALVLAPSFLIALYPPTAFDETTYHLSFVRAMSDTGSLPFLSELRMPTFPLLAEALQACLLRHGGEVATHLVAVLAAALTVALVASAGREVAGAGGGWIAAGMLAGSPLLTYLAATGLVEAPLMVLASGSLFAAARWQRAQEPRWAALAGLLAGSAASVKYLGLAFVGILALALVVARDGRRRALPAFLLAAVVTCGPTYGWLLASTGSPLVPFFSTLVGHTAWDAPPNPSPPLNERLADLASLPWDAVVDRVEVGRQPPLSPAYLIGLPLLPIVGWWRRDLRPALAVLLLYLAIFLVIPPDARYLLPVLPLWSLLVGAGTLEVWQRLSGRPPVRLAVLLLACGLALPGALYGAFYVTRQGPIPTAADERELFLARHVRGYRALAWLERRRGPDYAVYAAGMEDLHGLARGRLVGEWNGPYRYSLVLPSLVDPVELHRLLRGMDVTHLLVRRGTAVAPRGLERIYSDTEVDLYRLH